MRPPPLATGIGAGLVAALLLAPFTGSALGRLAKARAERAAVTERVAGAAGPSSPLVVPGAAAGEPAALVAHVRERARSGGVLVEEAAGRAEPGGLAVVRLRLSGPEKSVVALVDSLEREPRLVRLRGWRIEALPAGGVRLGGEMVGARQ